MNPREFLHPAPLPRFRALTAYPSCVTSPRRRAAGLLLPAVVLLGTSATLAACATGAVPEAAPPASASGSGSASPSPTPTASTVSASPSPSVTAEPVWRSPLTGEEGEGPQPVLVVKLDNTRNAQPHAGLADADVVYVEEVEYGITRLAAVFSSVIPDRIGPVRSARITDIDLLAQYGRPAFAYSGAQSKMFPVLDAAPFRDVSPRRGAEGYGRDGARRAPYNYFLDGGVALERAPKATAAQDMGFVFDEQVPAGGHVATTASMEWSYASAEFAYKPRRGTYAVSLNGVRAEAEERKDGQQADTVVIQYVKQEPSRFFDKGGGNTPHAETIGTGRAVVLRDGQGWKVQWSRPDAESGTTFTTSEGVPLPFKPGQVWIVLLDKDRKATVQPWTEPTPSAAMPSETRAPSPSTEPSSASASATTRP